jgi:hypothetical protein
MRHALAFLFLSLVLGHASAAAAHAEEPNSQRIFGVGDDGAWILRANFGIVTSDHQDRLICEEAFLGGDGWQLARLGPTEWVTFGESSVQRTEDGCTYEEIMSLERTVSDATAHPGGPVAFLRNGEADAGLWLSTDRGQSFERVAGIDTEIYQLTGVRFMDADTLILSGYVRADAGAAMLWSIDVQDTSVTELTAPANITFPYVLDARAGHILLLGRRDAQTLFWGTPDQIDIAEVEVSTWPSGAVLSEDGLQAWVSGPDQGRGVLAGTLDGEEATWETLAGDQTASCVAQLDDGIYICTLNRFDEFDVMRINPDGSVDGVLDFRNFAGVRDDCPAGSDVDEVCPLVWDELAPYFGLSAGDAGPGGDVSTADAGPDAGELPDTAMPAADSGPADDEVGGSACCSTIHDRPERARFPLLLGMLLALVVVGRVRTRGDHTE